MADWPATFLCSAARAVDFLNVRDGGVYVDATFGAGGYTRAILAAANCNVIGIDRDQHAIAAGFDLVAQAQGRLVLVQDRFSNLEGVARSCGYDAVDGVVLDVGVSSMQLDEAARGFSFRLDGPLDMRMGGEGPSAADVVKRVERARPRLDHRDAGRRAACPRRRPRHRARPRRDADRDHRRAGRDRRTRRACAPR